MPKSSMTYISPTTFGMVLLGHEIGRQRKADRLHDVNTPAPTIRNASAAEERPIHLGASIASP